jgi:hypothetical protein
MSKKKCKHEWDNYKHAKFAVRGCGKCGALQQAKLKWGEVFYIPTQMKKAGMRTGE